NRPRQPGRADHHSRDPGPDPFLTLARSSSMTNTAELLIAAGVVGAGYWVIKRRDQDADEPANRDLMDAVQASRSAEPKDHVADGVPYPLHEPRPSMLTR